MDGSCAGFEAWAWRCGAAAGLSGPRRGRVALFMQHSEDPYLEIRELLERSGRGGGGQEQPQATRHGRRGSVQAVTAACKRSPA